MRHIFRRKKKPYILRAKRDTLEPISKIMNNFHYRQLFCRRRIEVAYRRSRGSTPKVARFTSIARITRKTRRTIYSRTSRRARWTGITLVLINTRPQPPDILIWSISLVRYSTYWRTITSWNTRFSRITNFTIISMFPMSAGGTEITRRTLEHKLGEEIIHWRNTINN